MSGITAWVLPSLIAAIVVCSAGKDNKGDKTLKAKNMLKWALVSVCTALPATFAFAFANGLFGWGLSADDIQMPYHALSLMAAPASMYSWAVLTRWANNGKGHKFYSASIWFWISFIVLNPIAEHLSNLLLNGMQQIVYVVIAIVCLSMALYSLKGYKAKIVGAE